MKTSILLSALLLAAPALHAEDAPQLSRDESAVFKKKLIGALDALGALPEAYVKETDNFSLPAEPQKGEDGKPVALFASANRRLGSKASREAKKDMNDAGLDYQKKILAAQAKGDYAEVSRLSQEFSAKAAGAQMKVVDAQEKKKDPIDVTVTLNSGSSREIDPDAVLVEKPGLLVLKEVVGDEADGKLRVHIDADPVKLKDTKKISRSELRGSSTSVGKTTTVLSVQIDLEGPAAEVEAWAKRVDAKKLLSLID